MLDWLESFFLFSFYFAIKRRVRWIASVTMMSPSSLWCWAWGRRSVVSFVVFATLRWLWTTGHHPLSCLLPTQSFLLLYPLIGEETTRVSSTMGTPLVYRDRRQSTAFHLATNTSPALRLRTLFQGTRFCVCNCWVICYVKSISLPRKRLQTVDWPVVLWNGLSPSPCRFKTKCFPTRYTSRIFCLTGNCLTSPGNYGWKLWLCLVLAYLWHWRIILKYLIF